MPLGRESRSNSDDAHRGALLTDDPDLPLNESSAAEAGCPFGHDVAELEAVPSAVSALQGVYPGHQYCSAR